MLVIIVCLTHEQQSSAVDVQEEKQPVTPSGTSYKLDLCARKLTGHLQNHAPLAAVRARGAESNGGPDSEEVVLADAPTTEIGQTPHVDF